MRTSQTPFWLHGMESFPKGWSHLAKDSPSNRQRESTWQDPMGINYAAS